MRGKHLKSKGQKNAFAWATWEEWKKMKACLGIDFQNNFLFFKVKK